MKYTNEKEKLICKKNNIEESLEHVVISRSEHYHFLTFYVILILQARRDLGDNTFISIM